VQTHETAPGSALFLDADQVAGGIAEGAVADAVRLLGNLYLKIGLTRRAEALYLSLLTPALASQDTLAGKAITHQTLGEIYESLGNPQEAIKYYLEARKAFLALNDRELAGRVERRLSALRTP
jgi:tetratricopeptide (TPR) repeat protein